MAKKTKNDGGGESGSDPNVLSKNKFNGLMAAAKAFKSKTNEAKGVFGQLVKQAEADHNLHTDAFRVVRKYVDKDPAAATAFFKSLTLYWEYAKLATTDLDDVPAEIVKPSAPAKGEGLHGGNIAQFTAAGAA